MHPYNPSHPSEGLSDPSNVNITGGLISGVTISENFTTSTNPESSDATTALIVSNYNGVVITTNVNNIQTLANLVTLAVKIFTVINNDTSTSNQTIKANGIDYVLPPGKAQSFIWDGSAWGPTDLGITAIPVPVTQGGTGLATITDHGIMLGSGTTAITPLGVATDGQIPIGSSGADPVLAAITPGDGIDVTNAAGSITVAVDLKANGGLVIDTTELTVDLSASAITGTLAVGDGGTGASTLTDHGILLGSGTDAVTPLGAATNGQLPIGSTGADPVLATITEGEAIDITNAAGAITIACEDATTANKGVTVYSGTTKAIAGTDTASAMTPADVAAANAVLARESNQGVAMTAATTGSTGIQVAHSAVYANTTNSFGFAFNLLLPSYTVAAVLKNKFSGSSGVKLEQVVTSGIYRLTINTKTYDSTVPGGGAASNLVAGTKHHLAVIVTVVATTTVSFYLDGVLLNTTAAQANETISNSDILYLMGTSSTRTAGTITNFVMLNRSYTAAEVLDLYRNGIAFADKWGSQIPVYTSDFSAGVDGLAKADATNMIITGNTDSIDGEDDWLKVERINTTGRCDIDKTGVITLGKNYNVAIKIHNPAGSALEYFSVSNGVYTNGYYTPIAVPAGTTITTIVRAIRKVGDTSTTLTISPADSAGNRTTTIAAGQIYYLKEIIVYPSGATLALEPEGIQPAPGQWLDSSSNKMHAMQPATGSSLTRYKKDFEYRWTNTWTASSAAQYVGGLNQAILSADHFITSITTQATVTTDVENLTLGDGSDADRFVAAFAASATRTSQTIAAQNDGTNLKLVYTPAAEATMTVETIIRGFIWEP